MIVRDEEHNLTDCLKGAEGLFEDVVIVDTGSKDRTRELARSLGARVFDFPWIDSFSAARNESLRHARGEWIFWLDADDRLDADNREQLRHLLNDLPSTNVAYSIKCVCLPDPTSSSSTVVDHIRLFRNDPRIRWRYRIHEQILGAVRESGGEVRFANVAIHHVGYADPSLRGRKLQRDLRLLELEYVEQPHDPFTLFNLGQTYRELGRHQEALPLLRQSLRGSHPTDSIVRKLYSLLASSLFQLGQTNEALTEVEQGLCVCPEDAELLFLGGVLHTELQQYSKAKTLLNRLLQTQPSVYFGSVLEGLRGFQGQHQLALVHLHLGELAEAETLWRQVLRERPGWIGGWQGLAEVFQVAKRWRELEEHLARWPAELDGIVESILRRGRMLLNLRRFSDACSLLEDGLRAYPDRLVLLIDLSHVLLEEDRDHARAEQILLQILNREPTQRSARHNLEVLRQRMASLYHPQQPPTPVPPTTVAPRTPAAQRNPENTSFSDQ